MREVESRRFLGANQRVLANDRIHLDLSNYAKGVSFSTHLHADPFFCFVLNGICQERSFGRVVELKRADLVYHPAGAEHSDHWRATGQCLHVNLNQSFFHHFQVGDDREPVSKDLNGKSSILAGKVYEEFSNPDSVSMLAIEGLVLGLFAEVERSPKHDRQPIWLTKIRDRLDADIANPPDLLTLANLVQVHPAHLASTFKTHFGLTIGDYVRQKRVEEAGLLLTKTNLQLGEISLNLGFADQSHFSRTFKRQTGRSPNEYRRLYNNDSR